MAVQDPSPGLLWVQPLPGFCSILEEGRQLLPGFHFYHSSVKHRVGSMPTAHLGLAGGGEQGLIPTSLASWDPNLVLREGAPFMDMPQ